MLKRVPELYLPGDHSWMIAAPGTIISHQRCQKSGIRRWWIDLDRFGLLMPQLNAELGGGFKHFLFSHLFGEDSHFD